jgi:hypothetical protein
MDKVRCSFSRLVFTAAVGSALLTSATACSRASGPKSPNEPVAVNTVQENPIPGTVTEAWAEPMYDDVDVPGQLDPTGTYYRVPHRTIIEVRPGRVQEVQFPQPKEK